MLGGGPPGHVEPNFRNEFERGMGCNPINLGEVDASGPLQASSGRIVRHRLNRGGDRQANNALWTIALIRMRGDVRTKAYVKKRAQEGRSLAEIRRCLKRYIVRELYPLLLADLKGAEAPP